MPASEHPFDPRAYDAALREFIQRHADNDIARWESGRAAPLTLISQMAAHDLFKPFTFDSPGGPASLRPLAEALGRTRSLGLAGMVLSHLVLPLRVLQRHASSWLQEKYLLPALRGEAICTASLMQLWDDAGEASQATDGVRLRFAGDRLRLEGSQAFLFNVPGAQFVVALARTPGASVPVDCSLVALPLDASGVTVEQLSTIGFHSARIGVLHLSDCYLTPDHLIGERKLGRQYVLAAWVEHSLLVCAAIQALEEEVLSDTFAFVGSRAFMRQKLGDLQVVRHQLADITAEHEVAAAFCREAQEECAKAHWQLPGKAAMASLVVGETFKRSVEACLQLFGGRGYMATNWLTRAFRDAQGLEMLLGPPTSLKRMCAREMGL